MILSDDEIKNVASFDGTNTAWLHLDALARSHLKANARIRELEADFDRWFRDHRILSEAFIRQCDRADRLAVIADALAEELTITHDATIVSEGISIAVNLGGDLKDGESAASWVKRVIKERNRAEATLMELKSSPDNFYALYKQEQARAEDNEAKLLEIGAALGMVDDLDTIMEYAAIHAGELAEDSSRINQRKMDLWVKLRELAAAAEWRDECNDLYTEMHIDWLDGKPEAPRMMDSIYEISEEAEIAYQAALAAAREER